MSIGVTCWRCEEYGHTADTCQRPPPKDRKERDERIDRYVERWMSGAITRAQKRTWIGMENRALEKEKAK